MSRIRPASTEPKLGFTLGTLIFLAAVLAGLIANSYWHSFAGPVAAAVVLVGLMEFCRRYRQ